MLGLWLMVQVLGLFEFGDSGLGFRCLVFDHWGSGFAISGLVHRFGFAAQVWLRL